MASTTENLGLKLTTGSDLVDPVTDFSDNFKKLDKLGADYVIEQGQSGEWWYRKWNSGRAECGIDSHTFADFTTGPWGPIYNHFGMTFPAYPFAFSKAPFVTIMYRYETNNYGGIIHISPAGSNDQRLLTNPPQFGVVDAVGPHTYKNSKFGIFATGWYK